MTSPLTITLVYERSTQGLCRYEEVEEAGRKTMVVGALYLSKERLGDKPPKVLTVTITGGADAQD